MESSVEQRTDLKTEMLKGKPQWIEGCDLTFFFCGRDLTIGAGADC
jgi:hypothetical protein